MDRSVPASPALAHSGVYRSPTGVPTGEAVVLFSGGTDSGLAAAMMLEHFERVHLLTYQPGYVFRMDRPPLMAAMLQEKFGAGRVKYVCDDIQPIVNRILFGDIAQDLRKYGFNMTVMVCLGCRLSMHVRTLMYCIENTIPFIADGSISRQDSVPEQMASVIERNQRFYSEQFGVAHTAPVYDESRSDLKLWAMGVTSEPRMKQQFILYDTQGTCLFGVPADVYGKLFYSRMGDQRERDAEAYCGEKYPLMQALIESWSRREGVPLADRIAENRRIVAERLREQKH
ncbi:MAG: hypothetical protein GMKNLPBB_00113 [Myxococcota bacterium]|nr:hypothetical protein [Myxococcota bacterium]